MKSMRFLQIRKGIVFMNLEKVFREGRWKQTPEFTAVVSALVYGMLVHLFALTNILNNHDNIASQPGGYGLGVDMGRWFLEVLGRFFDKVGLNYNLPSINGVIYIALLAAAAALLVSALKIRSKISAALIGALFVAFPTVTVTMIYRYTAMFYGISAVMAVLAVWVLGRFRGSLPVSVVLIGLSMGIYQAYVPLTIALFVLQLIREGLLGEADGKKLVLHGLYDCLALVLGLGLYFVGMKVSVAMYGMTLVDYQGISTMGSISAGQIPQLVINALKAVLLLPVRDYCGVANRALMRIAYLLLGGISAAMILWIFVKKIKNVGTCVITGLLLVAFLLAVGFVEVMVPDGWIYTLMVYSFCLLACAPLVFLECLPVADRKKLAGLCRKAVILLVALLVFFYGYYANVNYTAVYFAGEQIDNYLSGVVLRATMTEGYTTDKQWVMIGDIQDPLFGGPWNDEITYTGLGFTEYLLNQYSRENWIENYIGYEIPMADPETTTALAETEEVQAMPCYPNAGSIRVVGDAVVVKFQNIPEG